MLDLRHLANILWAIGKLRVNLAAEAPLGPQIGMELERRILVVAAQEGMSDVLSCEHLWFGLSVSGYAWDKEMLQALLERTLTDMQHWENCKSASQVCISIAMLSVEKGAFKLSESQQSQLVTVIESMAAAGEGMAPQEAIAFILAATRLQLRVPSQLARRLHGLALSLPPSQALRGRFGMALVLNNCATALGYQPTAAEAQAWQELLVNGFPPDRPWTRDDVVWVATALSSCENLQQPDTDLLSRLQMLGNSLPDSSDDPHMAGRVAGACRKWSVRLAPGVLAQLERMTNRQPRRAA